MNRRARRSIASGLAGALAGAFAHLALAQPAPAAERVTTATTAPGGGEAALISRVWGFVQTDWVVHRQASEDELDPGSGEPLNRDRFLLRRARLAFDIEGDLVLGRLTADLNSVRELEVRPFDAYVGVRARGPSAALVGTLGLFRIPFGFDAVEAPNERPVLERTNMVRALFPGQRDFGIGVEASYQVFRLALAAMNGAPIGEAGSLGLDFDAAKDIVGRLGVDAQPARSIGVHVGVSGVSGRGFHPGTASTKDQLAWNDGNEDGFVAVSELSVIVGAPATGSRGFGRFALGADARLDIDIPVLGALVVRGEVIRAKNLDRGLEPADPVASGRDLRELGWALGGSLELTRFAQIAVQYDTYHPDDDARRQNGADLVPLDPSYSTLAVAGSARFAALRLIAEYDHNGNPLGRASNGSPTTLRDDAITLRGELSF